MNSILLFRQLYDAKTSTYTYIIADKKSHQAIIIDPVRDQSDRNLRILTELGLSLTYILDTHIHADHITGSGVLREQTGAKIAMGIGAQIANPDILLADGETLTIGEITIVSLSTPGHTDGCTSFLIGDMVFTGDALLIRKTGRTDFQGGSAEKLYHSIMDQIYTLPDDTLIYPGHDYTGQTESSIGEEKVHNTRIGANTTESEFVTTMGALQLPYPQYIDAAVPANMKLGV